MRHVDIVSPKILNFLTKKFKIKNYEELVYKIEESLLNYYKISLLDLNKYNDFEKKEKKVNFDNYVYIYMDPRYPIEPIEIYDGKKCSFLPFYIGKGKDKRSKSHLYFTKNYKMFNTIEELKSLNLEPIIEIVYTGLTNLMAHNLENHIISDLRYKNIDLCNLTLQNNSKNYDKIIKIEELHIEKSKNQLILDTLNNTNNLKEASNKLGISERTLHRKIKGLNIEKHQYGRVFYFKKK